ncbi:MAG: TonB-dependent receptor [Flavobacteriales bacterium]|nr:TonB-dependent receptor [Flavobacteriales bacterium]NNK81134.1 TonB-dependent receptor [Flavobacteriales bacterium]
MIRTVFTALLVLFMIPLQSQKVTVLDATDNSAINRAMLFNGSKKRAVTSGQNGQADISALMPVDTLYIQHASYKLAKYTIEKLQESQFKVYLIPQVIQMPTFELKAARESFIESPQQAMILDIQQIKNTQPRTTADLLERSGEVFVQRSQLGGGSPVLRGFEANRILLMIDGVRLNNAIYRSGHLQNAITVDPYLLESTEVLFGPGSLIYGSDALGGVVHFHTRSPEIIERSGKDFTLNFSQRLSTATQESATHWDAEFSGGRWASLTSFTWTRFGEMRMGENRIHGDEHWGLLPQFVERIDGKDSVIANLQPHIIPNSGYEQYDFAQKLRWRPGDSTSVLLNLQYSTSSNIPRSDQLAAQRDGRLRFAEWSYGPQERLLASVEIDVASENEAYDKAELFIAYQKVGENRITRNFNDIDRFVRQEDVGVFSFNGDFVKRLSKKDLYYGVEATSNVVDSRAYIEDIENLTRGLSPTRYPDGGSRMSTLAAYIALNGKPSKNIDYNLGIRYNHAYLNSRYNDTTFYSLPFTDITFDNGALTGSASITWRPEETWEFGLSSSTGFRTPNVDDYGKVFERAGIVVVPTNELNPEYTLNAEMRIAKQSKNEKILLEFAGFYTHILDAIVQTPSTLNGSDSLLYEGSLASIAVNANQEEAMIYGASMALTVRFSKGWTWRSTATQTIGKALEPDAPLSHIPPFFAKTGLDRSTNTMSYGTYVLYNDTKTAENMGPGRTDNADEGINGAFPSWYSLHMYFNYNLTRALNIALSLDNLTDVHYKTFASGISAPGRNFSFTLRYTI